MSERVYVADLELASGTRCTSVHRSYANAERMILEKANSWLDLDSKLFVLDNLDDEDVRDRIHSYGISYLPIED